MSNPAEVKRIGLIESSHHDLGWHKSSYDAEAAFTFREINTALDSMQKDPSFCWSQECCGFVYSYLQKFPERRAELARRIQEGRFDLGAGYTMPYTSFVTSEMLVRLFIYGKKWAEDTFPGCQSNVYYNTDVPGLGTQMPQIIAKSGAKYLYASRHWNFDRFRRNEFKQLESPDHSRIPAFFMFHYGDCVSFDKEGNADGQRLADLTFIESRLTDYMFCAAERRLGPALPLLYSMDCLMPSDLSGQIRNWNAYAEEQKLPRMSYTTMQKALDAVFVKSADLRRNTLKGEWPSKWFYENSASDHHTFLKQREAERLLRATEALSVRRAIAVGSFRDYPAKKLEAGWRDTDHCCHGYAPAVPIEDFRRIYGEAISIASEIYEENLRWLTSVVKTDPAKGDIRIVVYNNLSYVRDDIVTLKKPADLGSTFRILDARGREAPWQDGENGEILFLARAVPAMGYRVYYIQSEQAPACKEGDFPVGKAWTVPYKNAFYTITPVVSGGGLEAIIDRENRNTSLFSTEKFKIGELYDFQYDGKGAGEQFNMRQPHHGQSQLGAFAPWHCICSGPVCTVFETRSERTSRGPAALTLTVYRELKRVDFRMELDLDETPARQLRLMFPANMPEMFGADGSADSKDTLVSYQVPFGAVTVGTEMLPKFSAFNENKGDPNHSGSSLSNPAEFTDNTAVRPREVQNWVETSSSQKNISLTFSSYNLGWDYQDPTDSPVRTPVLQPVLMASAKSCHPDYGHWLQPGRHSYRFAMTSGNTGCTAGRAMAAGVNDPLAARVQTVPGTLLPETDSGVQVNRENVMITALKKAEDDDRHIVIRWYETQGRSDCRDVTITLPGTRITDAQKVNLIERPEALQDCSIRDSGFSGPVSPWSIETVMAEADSIR